MMTSNMIGRISTDVLGSKDTTGVSSKSESGAGGGASGLICAGDKTVGSAPCSTRERTPLPASKQATNIAKRVLVILEREVHGDRMNSDKICVLSKDHNFVVGTLLNLVWR